MSGAQRLSPSEALQSGHRLFGALISYWRGRSGLSGNQLAAIASWGLGEKGWIDSAVVSRIENGRLTRGCSFRNLLAFDAANAAIHAWQVNGQEAAWDAFGPHTAHGVREQWLTEAIWLPVPEDPAHPLDFADFAEVLVGRRELPYLGQVTLADGDAALMSEKLGDLLNDAIAQQAVTPREGLKELMLAYPSQDPDRRSRLMALVMGTGSLGRDELEAELYALAETLRVLRDLPAGSYGPGDLAAELSRALPPSE